MRSLKDKPTLAKLVVRLLRSKLGPGRNALAALLFAFRESLLPNLTFHVGPPYYNFLFPIFNYLSNYYIIERALNY